MNNPPLKCSVSLTRAHIDKNHREYLGWYHTDYTLPAEYFLCSAPYAATIHMSVKP